MTSDHLSRQEYIRLLRVHYQQLSTHTEKAEEQLKALKLSQQRRIASLHSALGVIKRSYLKIKHFSELRKFNSMIETNHEQLLRKQKEEIKRLKACLETKSTHTALQS